MEEKKAKKPDFSSDVDENQMITLTVADCFYKQLPQQPATFPDSEFFLIFKLNLNLIVLTL